MPHTATFFGLPFVQFADEVLRAPFPLPAMQQVFVPSEVARVTLALWTPPPSSTDFSSEFLLATSLPFSFAEI